MIIPLPTEVLRVCACFQYNKHPLPTLLDSHPPDDLEQEGSLDRQRWLRLPGKDRCLAVLGIYLESKVRALLMRNSAYYNNLEKLYFSTHLDQPEPLKMSVRWRDTCQYQTPHAPKMTYFACFRRFTNGVVPADGAKWTSLVA